MGELYERVLLALQEENREKALSVALDALESEAISIVALYEEVLGPALNAIIHEYPNDEDLIWREHVRSGIVRSIVEAAYPYVLRERDRFAITHRQKIIVMAPEFEDHDLGARMVADFFTIAGFDPTFVGARTPIKTTLRAVEIVQPQFLSISVTNYYNLISAKKTIESIKTVAKTPLQYLVGGAAFAYNRNGLRDVGGDYLMKNFQDILDLSREV